VHWNPSTSQLYMDAIVRGEGRIAEGGPLAVGVVVGLAFVVLGALRIRAAGGAR